ncbi:MAG: MarR family transcriptional regulator [Absicoccus sp.]|uniref:MarR family transcriptional regulator n=1 Tax=Absicoccus intestinalis TaxID=2926319 RepID=A0ABU4WM11_9FIRM|nr:MULTISPECIES: MarR family transcriptional regulator [unclassified Absicoccus]MDX8417607.1 MarR family transcriptional regulator [Absicoccus sp. CLA-KB-P134]MDY3036618.1 MarR family transcriptional regulator [Absicoccus sp.]
MQTIQRFNRINDEINYLYHTASHKMGLADSEMIILYLLHDYKKLTQSDIINRTGMTKQTVNSAIARMEKEGWVQLGKRTHHRKIISFTALGTQILQDVLGPFIQAEEKIFDDWSQEEIDLFLKLNCRYRDQLRHVVDTIKERR